jgi:hypothetical protein
MGKISVTYVYKNYAKKFATTFKELPPDCVWLSVLWMEGDN